MPAKRKPLDERIWARVDRQENGCWLWRGARQWRFGYGMLTV